MILPMEGDDPSTLRPGTPTVFLRTPHQERMPMFSRDGRWLAYLSNESGRYEVYVRPFPNSGAKWQVSTGGADLLAWSPRRQELFFVSRDGTIMVAAYQMVGEALQFDKPVPWSNTACFPPASVLSAAHSSRRRTRGDRASGPGIDTRDAAANDYIHFQLHG
jgi:hypothetical protein